MDLAMLIEVEEAADRLTALGVAQLAAGDPAAAKRKLTGAIGLRRTRLAELVLGFAEALEEQRR
jgi:Tfp pilus assembly protein PilF